jgi:hypothetical protein
MKITDGIKRCNCEWCEHAQFSGKYRNAQELANAILKSSGPFLEAGEIHAMMIEYLSLRAALREIVDNCGCSEFPNLPCANCDRACAALEERR